MKGECLCGAVAFEVEDELPNLYQCHCSLCRKVTGSNANAATFVSLNKFRWVNGQENITSFQKPTGYRSDFCRICGSPVPNQLRSANLVWVPAGLLAGDFDSEIAVHLHAGSSASWERNSEDYINYEAGPDSIDTLNQALQRPNR